MTVKSLASMDACSAGVAPATYCCCTLLRVSCGTEIQAGNPGVILLACPVFGLSVIFRGVALVRGPFALVVLGDGALGLGAESVGPGGVGLWGPGPCGALLFSFALVGIHVIQPRRL